MGPWLSLIPLTGEAGDMESYDCLKVGIAILVGAFHIIMGSFRIVMCSFHIIMG